MSYSEALAVNIIYQDNGITIYEKKNKYYFYMFPELSPTVLITKDGLKIMIEKLLNWYVQEFYGNHTRIVFESEYHQIQSFGNDKKPHLIVDSKGKMIILDGIKFLKDGDSIKIDSKNFEKLQELLLGAYYG